MKKLVSIFSLLLLPLLGLQGAAQAAGPKLDLKPAGNDIHDQASLQRGAVLYSNYCMACHSAKYIRYNRIAADLGWTDEEVIAKMTYGQNKPVDLMMTRMENDDVGLEVLGIVPPDLSLMARLKGTDYIYNFLTEYHQDEEGKWDNKILKGTSMPNVLEGIQRHSSQEDYEQAARDISNFLEYVGEPAKLKRLDLGWKVITFLLVLLLLTWLLKREYWKDIKH